MSSDSLNLKDEANCVVERRGPRSKEKLDLKGHFKTEHWRDGKLLATYEHDNQIVDAGLNKLLDVGFHGVTPIDPWYIGLVDNASFSAFNNADIMSSHGGWIENVDYDEAARVAWTEGAASGRAITNSSTCDFTMNATKVIKGIFLTSVSTKSGTTGTLWAEGAFGSTVSVVDNDVLKITYTITG